MFFANYASKVSLLVRAPSLAQSMSHYLIEQLATKANIEVCTRCRIVGVQGERRLEAIVIEHRDSGTQETQPASAVFVFIGADAQTAWLPPALIRDEDGYVCTGRDVMDLVARKQGDVAARARSLPARDQCSRDLRGGRRAPRLGQARGVGRGRGQHGHRLRPSIPRDYAAEVRRAPSAALTRRAPSEASTSPRRALAGLDRAVQVALRLDRRVLAGEEHVALALAFDPVERRVLARLDQRIGAERPRVAVPRVADHAAVPQRGRLRRDARELRAATSRLLSSSGRRPAATAAAPPEKKLRTPAVPGCARVTSHVVWNAPRSRYSPLQLRTQPEAVGELQLQLGVAAHAELVDRAPLARAEKPACRSVDAAQQRERQREDHAIGDLLAFGAVAQHEYER